MKKTIFFAVVLALLCFAMPAIALVPALFVIMVYGGQVKLPLGVPGGFVAVLLGVALGNIIRGLPLDEKGNYMGGFVALVIYFVRQ